VNTIVLARAGMANAISRNTGTPASMTGCCPGSWQNTQNISGASTKKVNPITDITPQPKANATQPLRAARSGWRAPSACPTKVIAAMPNAWPDR
jgi:hypothetical protein